MAIEKEWPTFREPDNDARSAIAAETLCYFARQTGLDHSGESVDTIMCVIHRHRFNFLSSSSSL